MNTFTLAVVDMVNYYEEQGRDLAASLDMFDEAVRRRQVRADDPALDPEQLLADPVIHQRVLIILQDLATQVTLAVERENKCAP